ncbi:hypothetical protein [Leptothermofonsia sp. ETS-13]|uniref:hypothetical protein n=1 Tax=Leptothermofonsia sp. ETS-13 TaxID=3035696 RepID=UPI003BA209AF
MVLFANVQLPENGFTERSPPDLTTTAYSPGVKVYCPIGPFAGQEVGPLPI